MWLVYEVKSNLYPIMEKLCDFFINHSEKGVKITILPDTKGGCEYYFKVSKDSCMNKSDAQIKVEGVIGPSNFRLRSTKNGFMFSADHCYDPEGIFFDVINIFTYYQTTINYDDAIDLNSIYDMREKDGPDITPTNYVAFTDNYIEPLIGILKRFFKKWGHHEVSGKFSYTIFDNMATKIFPLKDKSYIDICKKFISKFKELYFFDNVMLICIRVACVQYIYYLVNGSSLYYNSEDGSRAVIEEYYKRITNTLSKFGNNRRATMKIKTGYRERAAWPFEIYKGV